VNYTFGAWDGQSMSLCAFAADASVEKIAEA
jgi:hypothetical protein